MIFLRQTIQAKPPGRIKRYILAILKDELKYRKHYRRSWGYRAAQDLCREVSWKHQEYMQAKSAFLTLVKQFLSELQDSVSPGIEVNVDGVGTLRMERHPSTQYNWLAIRTKGENHWRYFYGEPGCTVNLKTKEDTEHDYVVQTATFEQYRALSDNLPEVVKAFQEAQESALED